MWIRLATQAAVVVEVAVKGCLNDSTFDTLQICAIRPLIITARAYARAVLGVVILSVCPSVCHTRAL